MLQIKASIGKLGFKKLCLLEIKAGWLLLVDANHKSIFIYDESLQNMYRVHAVYVTV